MGGLVDLIRNMRPQSVGSKFNEALPAANTNILTSYSVPVNGTVRVTFQSTVAGVLSSIIVRSGTSKTLKLNSGIALTASALYGFDIPVKVGDSFNIQYSVTGGTIDYLEIQFLRSAT